MVNRGSRGGTDVGTGRIAAESVNEDHQSVRLGVVHVQAAEPDATGDRVLDGGFKRLRGKYQGGEQSAPVMAGSTVQK